MEDTFSDHIRRARAGDREALNDLLLEVQQQISRHARTKLGGLRARVRVSDLLQSTYLDVVRDIGEFRGASPGAFAAWVDGILEHNIRDKRRFFAAKKRAVEREDHQSASQLVDSVPNPLEEVASEEELGLVHEALELLPEHYRDVLRRRFEGQRFREIGEAIGSTESTTRVLHMRARAALILEVDRLRQ